MYDLAIIGGGPAGYVAAERAGQGGLSVVLFEKKSLGGVCLNEGCIPTKTLLYTAKLYDNAKSGSKYGLDIPSVAYHFDKIMARKNKVVKKLVSGVSSKMKAYGIDVVSEHATILGKKGGAIQIQATEKLYEAKNLLICTGSEAFVPPINGINDVNYYTNREILQLDALPEELTIIGGGVIGIEFASFFSSMGTKVTVIEMMDEILPGIDADISSFLRKELTTKGVQFHLSSKVTQVSASEVNFEKDGQKNSHATQHILVSVGRMPNIKDFGLENLNVELYRNSIKTDEKLKTNVPNVYAAGDVNGKSLLAHTASREGEVVVNQILGKNDTMRYHAVPGVVYTNPEISSVGLTEEDAKKKGISYKVKTLPMQYAGRFIAENEGKNGFAKILVGSTYEEILGVHMVGNPSSEMIFGAAMAIEAELTLKEFKEVIFPHPTVSEILKETAFAFGD